MNNQRDITLVRLFSLFLLAFIFYLCWVPSLSSLKQSNAHVVSLTTNLARYTAIFQLDNGQTLKCSAKGAWFLNKQICPANEIQRVYDSKETIVVFYAGDKIWKAETLNKQVVIDYDAIHSGRWFVMGLAVVIFLGIFFFAPALIGTRQ